MSGQHERKLGVVVDNLCPAVPKAGYAQTGVRCNVSHSLNAVLSPHGDQGYSQAKVSELED